MARVSCASVPAVRQSPARLIFELFVPPLSQTWPRRALELGSFGVGSALCLSWLRSIAGYGAMLIAGLSLMAVYAAANLAPSPVLRRVLAAPLIAVHVGFAYSVTALTAVLGWTLPLWLVAVIVLAFVWVLAAPFTRRAPRAALCLPLGVWIAGLLAGWLREDGTIRCDDYLKVAADPAIRIVVPTNTELRSCSPGERLLIGRYPRRIWQSQGGNELVFTTQPGILNMFPSGRRLSEELPGSVCSAALDGSRRPACFGLGKAQAIADSERHDRLFIAAWGKFDDEARGVVYSVSRTPPLKLLGEVRLREQTGEMFYDAESDLLGVLSDEGETMTPIRAATLEALEPIAAPLIPGDTRYDQQRKEGVFCFAAGPLRPIDGSAYAAVAFRGAPFAFRPLAPSSRFPSSWLALTWGCDWDPSSRRVYVAVSDFGLLYTIDYDSGDVLERNWVGFGVRQVQLDRARGRVFYADFLRGIVTERDLASSRELRSWFVGRFVRGLSLARDGGSLLVSSNLGVVQVRL